MTPHQKRIIELSQTCETLGMLLNVFGCEYDIYIKSTNFKMVPAIKNHAKRIQESLGQIKSWLSLNFNVKEGKHEEATVNKTALMHNIFRTCSLMTIEELERLDSALTESVHNEVYHPQGELKEGLSL